MDGHIITPRMLDMASEALSRFLAGKEKIASRGTVYTRHLDVSFMCCVAISRFLQKRFPRLQHREIDRFVFGDRLNGEKQGHVLDISNVEADQMLRALLDMRVLDPACGSGAFLAGIATKRGELISKLSTISKKDELDLEKISRKLVTTMTGVDSDALAIQVAKIRVYLWYLEFASIPWIRLEDIELPKLHENIVLADFFWFHVPADIHAFDIVIGNPPYVRQEDIKPGRNMDSLPARLEKDRYKAALRDKLKEGIPIMPRLSRVCDLYVYFFIKAIQVLRPGGELCFLTSNTWLDAKFGLGLRLFLLQTTSGLSIFDFNRRSFECAEINTVITACTRCDNTNETSAHVSFVHFKIPPEQVVTIPAWREQYLTLGSTDSKEGIVIEAVDAPRHVINSVDARLVVVDRDTLIHSCQGPDNLVGGKWRVNYLNEHDIFYSIMRKAAGKFVPLGSIATVKAGCYSGINDFFYVNNKTIDRFGIEANYLYPLFRSAKDVLSLEMAVPTSNFIVAIPPVSKEKLKKLGNDGIVAYITWGESQRTRPGQKTAEGIPWPLVESVKSRKCWYSLSPGNLKPARLFMQYIAHDRFYCPWSIEPVVPDRCFHRIEPHAGIDLKTLAAILNSTLQVFMVMVTGRAGLGGGALKLEVIDAKSMLVLDPRLLSRDQLEDLGSAINDLGRRGPLSIIEECGLDPSRPYQEQTPSPMHDRLALDTVIFDVLGLSEEEREAMYRTTCSAVTSRLKKARTLPQN
ncbi:MAG: Eco57I restriction-modification methylase domain-containing protein [Candidatus Sigynarchaeota archaeon]